MVAFCHHSNSDTIAGQLSYNSDLPREKEHMVADRSQDSFAEAFERVLNETDTSIRRLSRLSGIPRRTLENWLYGRTQRPRYVEPILKVARALNLPVDDANKLLAAADYPAIAD